MQSPLPTLPTPATDPARAALLRLSLIEVWERFSYYTLLTLLPLFLVAPVADGGMAWTAAAALSFYGVVMAIVQILPFPCGLAGERWLGNRQALRLGAWLMMAGHLLMGAMAFAPAAALVPLLVAALGLVALGNGFFKPNISAMVGRLPHPGPAAADAAFGTFYVWVNVGAAAASVIAGYAADRFGWHVAFSLAAIGMAIALLLMRLFAATALDPVARAPARLADKAAAGPAPEGWVPALLAILLLSVLFAVALYQQFGTISLFAESRVDRDVLGFTIPTGWFLAMNPIVMVVLMPPLARAWREGRGPGHAWPPTTKMRAGFLLLALAFALLLAAVLQAEDGLASPLWIVGCVVLITTAELFIGPVALAAVSRVAPPERAVAAMGGFVAALGIGGLGAGQLGALAAQFGPVPVVLAMIAGTLLTAALVWRLAPWFAKRNI